MCSWHLFEHVRGDDLRGLRRRPVREYDRRDCVLGMRSQCLFRFRCNGMRVRGRLRGRRARELLCMCSWQALGTHTLPRRLDKSGRKMLWLVFNGCRLGERAPGLRRSGWRPGLPRQPSTARPFVAHFRCAILDQRQRQVGRRGMADCGGGIRFLHELVLRRAKRWGFLGGSELRCNRLSKLRLLG
jgi:hypothetical protein